MPFRPSAIHAAYHTYEDGTVRYLEVQPRPSAISSPSAGILVPSPQQDDFLSDDATYGKSDTIDMDEQPDRHGAHKYGLLT